MGHGPSSSHTMGPMRAAQMFLERNRGAVRFNVTLYGSLAATGKGHMTDAAILEVLQPVAKTNITWEPKTFLPFHPGCCSSRIMRVARSWIRGPYIVSAGEPWRTSLSMS